MSTFFLDKSDFGRYTGREARRGKPIHPAPYVRSTFCPLVRGTFCFPSGVRFFICPDYSKKIKLRGVLHANAGVPRVAHAYPRARQIYFTFSCHLLPLPRWPPPRKTYPPNNPAGITTGHTSRTHARCPFCHAGNVPMPSIDAGKPSHSRITSPPIYPARSNRKPILRHWAIKKPPALRPGASLRRNSAGFIRRSSP